MANDDLRICPACREGYMECSSRQTDPGVCPNCGALVSDQAAPADDPDEDLML